MFLFSFCFVFCFVFVGLGGPGGGFGAPGGGFSGSRSSGKPLLLLRLKNHPQDHQNQHQDHKNHHQDLPPHENYDPPTAIEGFRVDGILVYFSNF